ncbi:hypothetical protein [Candidatus Poriferisodalis sp.]|uniref:hypothetical protein n=1 Tax=Candidatus Poriferisodalis sp. TaxID=3101277 RepID=UPI003B028123
MRTLLALLAAFVLVVATAVSPVGAQDSTEPPSEDATGDNAEGEGSADGDPADDDSDPADDDSETSTESMPQLTIGGGNYPEVPSGFSGVLGRFHIQAGDDPADDDSAGDDSDGVDDSAGDDSDGVDDSAGDDSDGVDDSAGDDSDGVDSAAGDDPADDDSAGDDSDGVDDSAAGDDPAGDDSDPAADGSAADDSSDACTDDDGPADEIEWSLSGPDSDLLQINSSGVLCFAAPRFVQFVGGNDANGDDVFEVTIEASPRGGPSVFTDTSVTVFGDGPDVLSLTLLPGEYQSLLDDQRLLPLNFMRAASQRTVYFPGETISALVEFGDSDTLEETPVIVEGAPQLLLNVDGTLRIAEYVLTSGPTVRFEYTVVDGDWDSSGVSIDANSLRLNGGSITDGSRLHSDGRIMHSPLTHSQVSDSFSHTVAHVTPFKIVGDTALTFYAGSNYNVIDDFVNYDFDANYGRLGMPKSENIHWRLVGADAAANRNLFWISPYGHSDENAEFYLSRDSRHGDVEPGNYAVTLVAISEYYQYYAATLDLVVTVVAPPPEIDLITFGPSPAGGNYAVGDVITVNVRFDANVTVTGTPQIAMDIGGVERLADYDGEASPATGNNPSQVDSLLGSDGATEQDSETVAVFRYTVVEGDADSDGVMIPANSLGLNGGSIVDAEGTEADLTHTAVQGGVARRVATPGGL